MTKFLAPLLHFLLHLGYFGPFVLGVFDSSFLFLPLGNDLLIVVLVARHHQGYPWYVLAAVCGAAVGVLLLDIVARKIGETGVQKVAGQKRFEYLKRKIGERGAISIWVACLAPPPFPFSMVIATNSALAYPRKKLIAFVAIARAIRFLILGYLAIHFGHQIMRIINSGPFKWTMIVFVFICLVGSVLSIMKWVKKGGRRGAQSPAPAPAQ